MPTPPKAYRVYCYDHARRIVTSDWVKAENDEQAVVAARAQGFGTKCEIWDRDRLVASLEDERRQA